MKYVVWETCCGELLVRVALCSDIKTAEKFIESCVWATDVIQNIENPVIEIVDDETKLNKWEIESNKKRFRRDTSNI